MEIVLLTAIGVGGATIAGAMIGLLFKNISSKGSDIILAFAAGVMLAAAVLGLVIPSLEHAMSESGSVGVLVTVAGIFAGAISLSLIDKLVPYLHRIGRREDGDSGNRRFDKVMLFVIAIGIHNLPEGIAAGVGFGSGNTAEALMIAGGIALQNIPEGMVIISPMLASGISPARTFLIALATGLVEVFGTLLGFFAVSLANAILPFSLAFAGGTMLYVIADDMIPETHTERGERLATYALLLGFSLMLVFDAFL